MKDREVFILMALSVKEKFHFEANKVNELG
jgi:hypothetical protein